MNTILKLELGLISWVVSSSALANNTPQTLPFSQNWSDIGLITTNDIWSNVPGIVGFRGDSLTAGIGTDPQTILTESTVIDLIANQSNPIINNGGVAEFDGIANPVVALQGSSTATAPYLQLHLNTTGMQNIRVSYLLRDIDSSTDNAVQPVALQYRIGNTGNFINVPAGFVANTTTGPSLATLATPVSVLLPAVADNLPELQIRMITCNAAGNDEWVGIDDIVVTQVPIVKIHDIQGAGHLSPLIGQAVVVSGIVTLIRSDGFYMQDPFPDGDPATSEGLFVFTGPAPTASTGQSVLVTGTVTEFRTGGSGSTNLTMTEIAGNQVDVRVLSSGNPLPPPAVIGVGGRIPPAAVIEDDATGNVETSGAFDPAADGMDFYESLEGMRVQLNSALVVGPTIRFGTLPAKIPVVGDGGTQAGLRSARGGLIAQPSDFNPERIILTDTNANTPDAKVGDQFNGPVIGVIDYTSGNFNLLLSSPYPALTASVLPKGSTTLVGGTLRLTLATMNLDNLTVGDAQTKFNGFAAMIVNNLASPSIICADEMQDDNGQLNDIVVTSDLTLNRLISAIALAGGPTYSSRYISPLDDQDGGAPGANVRQVFLFRPDIVSFVDKPGASATTANSVIAGPALQFSPGRIDPANPAFINIRKPLAGEFLFRGQQVIVIANHFITKGSDDPLFGKLQPPTLNSEPQRSQGAQVVKSFVQALLGAGPAANVVTAGNFNDFEFSAPLATLETAPLANLVKTLPASDRYTYNFDGNSEAFHHILVSQHLVTTSRIEAIHNSSEYITSDRFTGHDPLVASVLTGVPVDFAQWQSFYFKSQDLSAGLPFTSFAGDPDADGMVNGLEAALGTEPQSRSSGNAGSLSAVIVGSGSGQRLVMGFDMPSTALSDLTIDAEESPSLAPGSWSTIATKAGTSPWSGPAIVTVATRSAEMVHVQVQSLQNPSVGKTFLRLKVRH